MKLHRPYIRKSTRDKIKEEAEKQGLYNKKTDQYFDYYSKEPIEGKPHLGHKYGCENARAIRWAEEQGLTQKEFNDIMNNPDLYQYEDPMSNMSHKHEMKGNDFDYSELMNTLNKHQTEDVTSNKAKDCDKFTVKESEVQESQQSAESMEVQAAQEASGTSEGWGQGWGETSGEGQGESAGQSM